MSKRTIVTLPGDGIGKAVLDAAIRVLDAAGFEADYVEGDIGWEFWKKEGNPLPERTLQLIEKHKIALFGAITSKPKDAAAEELGGDYPARSGADLFIAHCESAPAFWPGYLYAPLPYL